MVFIVAERGLNVAERSACDVWRGLHMWSSAESVVAVVAVFFGRCLFLSLVDFGQESGQDLALEATGLVGTRDLTL